MFGNIKQSVLDMRTGSCDDVGIALYVKYVSIGIYMCVCVFVVSRVCKFVRVSRVNLNVAQRKEGKKQIASFSQPNACLTVAEPHTHTHKIVHPRTYSTERQRHEQFCVSELRRRRRTLGAQHEIGLLW